MTWPFKRKPKVIDRRVPNDFRPGDKVECVDARWSDNTGADPEVGDVLTIASVDDCTDARYQIRAFWLTFRAIPFVSYESTAFRKLVDTDDAAMISRIKSVGMPQVAA